MPKCPVCQEEMRQTRRGATLAKHGPSYVCPANEAEIVVNEHGHRMLRNDARHRQGLRAWSEDELAAGAA